MVFFFFFNFRSSGSLELDFEKFNYGLILDIKAIYLFFINTIKGHSIECTEFANFFNCIQDSNAFFFFFAEST